MRMARINVYVPDELAARIKAANDKLTKADVFGWPHEIPVSQVFQRAIETLVTEIENMVTR